MFRIKSTDIDKIIDNRDFIPYDMYKYIKYILVVDFYIDKNITDIKENLGIQNWTYSIEKYSLDKIWYNAKIVDEFYMINYSNQTRLIHTTIDGIYCYNHLAWFWLGQKVTRDTYLKLQSLDNLKRILNTE